MVRPQASSAVDASRLTRMLSRTYKASHFLQAFMGPASGDRII
jgi:hypothetical protein